MAGVDTPHIPMAMEEAGTTEAEEEDTNTKLKLLHVMVVGMGIGNCNTDMHMDAEVHMANNLLITETRMHLAVDCRHSAQQLHCLHQCHLLHHPCPVNHLHASTKNYGHLNHQIMHFRTRQTGQMEIVGS